MPNPNLLPVAFEESPAAGASPPFAATPATGGRDAHFINDGVCMDADAVSDVPLRSDPQPLAADLARMPAAEPAGPDLTLVSDMHNPEKRHFPPAMHAGDETRADFPAFEMLFQLGNEVTLVAVLCALARGGSGLPTSTLLLGSAAHAVGSVPPEHACSATGEAVRGGAV